MDTVANKKLLKKINQPLIQWFHSCSHVRQMPWRENRDGYRVWVSEIMLQQTRVEAVKPYYIRFMEELPDVHALASAQEERLMKLWEGLGYYSRVRNMKKAAEQIVSEFGGNMPEDFNQLRSLPGIGNYTAGAISSIAFGQAVPAVDGNVLRVISRIIKSYEDVAKPATKTAVEKLLYETMSQDMPGDYNEGLMELGATICIPAGSPRCEECPLNRLCKGYLGGVAEQIPVKTAAKEKKIERLTVFLLETKDQIAIHKRADKGLLAGMYELPNVKGHFEKEQLCDILPVTLQEAERAEKLPSGKHVFSHVEWQMEGYRLSLDKSHMPQEVLLVNKSQLQQHYAIPSAFDRYIKLIK